MAQVGGNFTSRVSRQLAYISEFTTDIRHIRGEENLVADALSRSPALAPAAPVSAVSAITARAGAAPPSPASPPILYSVSRPEPPDYSVVAAAQVDDEELQTLRRGSTALKLVLQDIPDSPSKLWCDVSCGIPRPYIPLGYRRQVFEHYHSLNHPGILGSHRLISRRAVWPGMRRDIKEWARSCLACQRAKVFRHTRAPPHTIPMPTQRFHTVHVDIVGPLPLSRGHRYLFTCVDRVTRWGTAIPMPDCTAETTASSFLSGWVAQFGAPVTIITDQGAQFESRAWRELLSFLGTRRNRTTAYHPQSNGMVERFHRRLKESLRALHQPASWVDALPVLLLTIRATEKEDLQHSPAELVYGEDLRLPGQFSSQFNVCPSLSFLPTLKQAMAGLQPVPPRQSAPRPAYLPAGLRTAPALLLRMEARTGPLHPPYTGPYPVLARDEKHVTIQVGGRPYVTSWDRVKPAVPPKPGRPPDSPSSHTACPPPQPPHPPPSSSYIPCHPPQPPHPSPPPSHTPCHPPQPPHPSPPPSHTPCHPPQPPRPPPPSSYIPCHPPQPPHPSPPTSHTPCLPLQAAHPPPSPSQTLCSPLQGAQPSPLLSCGPHQTDPGPVPEAPPPLTPNTAPEAPTVALDVADSPPASPHVSPPACSWQAQTLPSSAAVPQTGIEHNQDECHRLGLRPRRDMGEDADEEHFLPEGYVLRSGRIVHRPRYFQAT